MTCRLIEIPSGKQIGEYDCYHELEPDAPAWVKDLEGTKQ